MSNGIPNLRPADLTPWSSLNYPIDIFSTWYFPNDPGDWNSYQIVIGKPAMNWIGISVVPHWYTQCKLLLVFGLLANASLQCTIHSQGN